ncbi:MAG TPA: NAD(P)-dependent glycerol-1-phosphate dehydrogenase [Methanotrichaceae archaeon]|nr:NAD(P)-dependent glycerol-1-phosphate dehydrogenase [Methanotrichaceae archaeon]
MLPASWMELPRIVVSEKGAVCQVAAICCHLKLLGPALILTGPSTGSLVGGRISALLEDAGMETATMVTRASRLEEVDAAAEMAREMGAAFVVGAGGGRSIDIAKLSSLRLDLPFISVPTAASHDGICSAQASLTVNGESTSVSAQAPLAIVADVEVISKAPPRLMAAGCGDVISNYTAILDWKLARRLRGEEYSEYAAALSSMTASMIVDLAPTLKPGLEESAKVLIHALISSGVAMSIAGSSRPASGSEHMFAHAVNRLAPGRALHGELCGLGTIVMMYLHGGDWQRIREALRDVGAPITADEAGLDSETVIEALLMAPKIRPERYTILGTGLTREAAVSAARSTKVI